MSNSDKKTGAREDLSDTQRDSTSLERYDLTGNIITRWTILARKRLSALLAKTFQFSRKASDTQLPGHEESVGEKAKKLPAKGIDFIESHIDKTTVDNQLKASQTETEFLKQELIRQQIVKAKAEAKTQHLENISRQLEIQSRIEELTSGKTDVRIVWEEDEPVVLIANLPDIPATDGAFPIHKLTIYDMGLSQRIVAALESADLHTIGDLIQLDRASLLRISGIGEKLADVIEFQLSKLGFKLHQASEDKAK